MYLAPCAKQTFKNLLWTYLFLCLCSSMAIAADKGKAFTSEEITILSDALSGSDWGPEELSKLLKHPQVQRYADAYQLNIAQTIPITDERYAHFSEPYALKKLQRFRKKWASALKRAEQKFDVDASVVSAVLLVETGLGRYRGSYNVFAVFASVYLDTFDALKADSFAALAPTIQERIRQKQSWSLTELRALHQMKNKLGFDLTQLKGSFAGAFGFSQFLPSSYLEWAVSSRTGTAKANLSFEPDAIFSTANFLKHHGYTRGTDETNKRSAIWAYNHSDAYVNTVLRAAVAAH